MSDRNIPTEQKVPEPWETTTNYGRADLTLHPVVRECYRVACLIERCGASEDLTRASSAAFDLCEKVFDALMNLCDAGIADEKEAKRMRAALVKSIEVIQQWHNGGLRGKDASELWDIYWRNAPEMKPIRDALTALERSQP